MTFRWACRFCSSRWWSEGRRRKIEQESMELACRTRNHLFFHNYTTPHAATPHTHHPHLPTRFFSKTVSPERWLTITGIIVVLPFYQVHDRLADPRLKSVGPIFCIILFLVSRVSLSFRLRGLIAGGKVGGDGIGGTRGRVERDEEGGGCRWQPKCQDGKPGRATWRFLPNSRSTRLALPRSTDTVLHHS